MCARSLLASESSSEDQSNKDREKLIALLLAAYAFTQEDISALASLLSSAYLAAMQRAAQRALTTLHAAGAQGWQPLAAQIRAAEAQALEAAKGIAATFTSLLEGFLRGLGSLLNDAQAAVGRIADWARGLFQWKVPQIVNVTCGSGNDAGTSAVVEDLLDGTLVDADEPDLVIGANGYQFTVEPEESSNDTCKDYAGKTFSMDQWDEVPDFPIHPECPHEKILISV